MRLLGPVLLFAVAIGCGSSVDDDPPSDGGAGGTGASGGTGGTPAQGGDGGNGEQTCVLDVAMLGACAVN